ncbi:MAG TPA: FAD-dependent oxidoreductase, partial [Phototrophicaceae bacterium]|nr:FAD-dependent oxidoreductase [Phototrophicaceae bacterium]
METTRRPRVIVIGAGFGGLYAARRLANSEIDVLVIDRNNYHLFTPLLYQVATCGLDPSQIAYPVRGIFRNFKNVRFLLGEVTTIDYEQRSVTIRENGDTHHEAYDYLVIAAGSINNFFGNDQISQIAYGMKDLNEAITLRNHILKLFEKAAWVTDEAERRALTTLVVVGGGPTGLETAGALYELYNYVLKAEYG